MTADEMPDVFDRLTEQAQRWAEEFPEPPDFELASDRELSCTDRDEHVEVTMRDFRIGSVRIDETWYAEWLPSLVQIELAVAEAVNAALVAYWNAELADAKAHRTPMGEIAAGLEQLSADFRGAYEKAVARLEAHE